MMTVMRKMVRPGARTLVLLLFGVVLQLFVAHLGIDSRHLIGRSWG